MATKYGDFKLIAFKGKNPSGKSNSAIIMAKKKNGLFCIYADRAVYENHSSFTFFLGGSLSIATLKDDHIEIAIPEKEEILKVKLVKEDDLDVFMATDYHGFEI